MGQVYINSRILDGSLDDSGRMVIQRGHVFVDDGIITKIMSDNVSRSKDDSSFSGYEVTDIGDKYLLPGLINMHVHLPLNGNPVKVPKFNINIDFKFLFDTFMPFRPVERYFARMAAKNAQTAFYSGITTIRTVGGLLAHDAEVRDNIYAGKMPGPRIYSANTAISVPGGHFAGSIAKEATGPEHARELVREIAETKPDLIKLMVTGGVMDASEEGIPGKLMMPPEVIRAACDEAHNLGYKVAAHVESTEGLREALKNGVDFIEHGADPDEECIRLFKEKKAALVCTLLPFMVCAGIDPKLGYCPETNVVNGTKVLYGIVQCARKCLQNNIPVGLGTDAGCPFSPHYDLWRELDLFTRFTGVSNDFALHTATQVNAGLMEIDAYTGSICEGKAADFMVVENNPLDDLSALRKPLMVSMGGKTVVNPKVKKHPVAEREFDKIREIGNEAQNRSNADVDDTATEESTEQITEDSITESAEDKVILRTEDLCKSYGKAEGKTIALDHVNLEIYKGELVVILGSSGSGKSTLLNMLGGVDVASSGKVIFNNENICEYNDYQLTKYRKDNIGFVFQSFNLIQTLTVRENISMALDEENDARIDEVLEIVSLPDKKDSYPSQLSGGQQQRVSIARALVKDAPLLLCDEPTGALDYENGKNIIVKLEELSRIHHKTVVIVTHTKEIGEMADRVIMMRNSRITDVVVNEKPVPAELIEW